MSTPSADYAFPALFEIDLDTREATGVVHAFCSNKCRDTYEHFYEENLRLKAGTSTSRDFGFVPKCEECGGYVEEYPPDHQGTQNDSSRASIATRDCSECGAEKGMPHGKFCAYNEGRNDSSETTDG